MSGDYFDKNPLPDKAACRSAETDPIDVPPDNSLELCAEDICYTGPADGDTVKDAIDGLENSLAGKMDTLVYDSDVSGSVDNSERLGFQEPDYYLNRNNHSGQQSATTVSYDNAGTPITSTDVQGAISELATTGAGTFIGLNDTPADYTGAAGSALAVTAGEDGIEFVPLTGGGDMLKSVYDTDNTGIVDNAEALGGNTPDYYAAAADLTSHVGDTANPHGVTTAQIGAATDADLAAHTGDTANPHNVTLAQVGGEADLGVPATDGQLLRSDVDGTRYWSDPDPITNTYYPGDATSDGQPTVSEAWNDYDSRTGPYSKTPLEFVYFGWGANDYRYVGPVTSGEIGTTTDADWMILQGGTVAWGNIIGELSAQTDLQAALDAKADGSALDAHIGDTANPHGVTAAQVNAEPALGNPTIDGQVLTSTAAGARSWATVGDMNRATYDTDNSGVVDDAELLGGQTPSYYLSRLNHTGSQAATTVDYDNTGTNITATEVQGAITELDGRTGSKWQDGTGNIFYDGSVGIGTSGAYFAEQFKIYSPDSDVDVLFRTENGNCTLLAENGTYAARFNVNTIGTVYIGHESLSAGGYASFYHADSGGRVGFLSVTNSSTAGAIAYEFENNTGSGYSTLLTIYDSGDADFLGNITAANFPLDLLQRVIDLEAKVAALEAQIQ